MSGQAETLPTATSSPTNEHIEGNEGGGPGPQERYNFLLNQVHLVNKEVQEARVLIANFKSENEELVRNFETCKEQLLKTRKMYNITKEELLEATERQMKSDQKNEAFREEAMAQMAKREEVLRDMNARLVPQDLDILRIQIEEEIEAPLRAKITDAEAEANKFETMFYNVRRAFEKERTEHALFKEQVRAAIDSDRKVFESEVTELQAALEKARSELMHTSLDDALNSAQEALQKSTMRETLLKEEIGALHRKLEEADALRLGDASAAVDALAAAQSDLTQANTDLSIQKHLVADVENKVHSLTAENASLREALSEKAVEIDRIKAETAQRERDVNETEKRVLREGDRRKAILDAEAKKNEERRKQAEEDCMKERDAASAERRACRERCEQAIMSEEKVMKEAKRAIEVMQSELSACQSSESALRVEFKQVVYRMENEARTLSEKVNEYEIKLASSQREISALQQKLERVSDDVAVERKEKEAMSLKESASLEVARVAKECSSDLELKCNEAIASERAQAAALAHLQKEYSLLVAAFDNQRKQHMESICKLEHDFELEREELTKDARRQHELLRASAAAALEKENKRSEKYKDAARSAHESGKRARSQLLKVTKERKPPKQRSSYAKTTEVEVETQNS